MRFHYTFSRSVVGPSPNTLLDPAATPCDLKTVSCNCSNYVFINISYQAPIIKIFAFIWLRDIINFIFLGPYSADARHIEI